MFVPRLLRLLLLAAPLASAQLSLPASSQQGVAPGFSLGCIQSGPRKSQKHKLQGPIQGDTRNHVLEDPCVYAVIWGPIHGGLHSRLCMNHV